MKPKPTRRPRWRWPYPYTWTQVFTTIISLLLISQAVIFLIDALKRALP